MNKRKGICGDNFLPKTNMLELLHLQFHELMYIVLQKCSLEILLISNISCGSSVETENLEMAKKKKIVQLNSISKTMSSTSPQKISLLNQRQKITNPLK